MTTAPRDALDRLVAALEAHFGAVTRRTGEADPAVNAAYQTLADAFETYDDALYDAYDEVTPFVLVDEADDEDDDEDEDDLDEDDIEEDDLDDDLDEDDIEDEPGGAREDRTTGSARGPQVVDHGSANGAVHGRP
jgi:hypothetical protein